MPSKRSPLSASAGDRSCGSLDLGKRLVLLEASLLLQPHDLEAVKVGQTPATLLLQLLLGPVGLLPLGVDLGLLPRLLDGAGPGAAGQLLDRELRDEDVGERDLGAESGELGV